jgi:hypothetical protein
LLPDVVSMYPSKSRVPKKLALAYLRRHS